MVASHDLSIIGPKIFLKELEEVRGPMGLPIERDLYFRPKTLEEIAPEMFREVKNNE